MSARRNLLRRNDLRLTASARSLSAADWQQPILCTEWTHVKRVLRKLHASHRAEAASIYARLAAS